MVILEASVYFPGTEFLEDCTVSGQLRLMPLVIAAAVIYGGGTYLAYRKAAQNYEKVDL